MHHRDAIFLKSRIVWCLLPFLAARSQLVQSSGDFAINHRNTTLFVVSRDNATCSCPNFYTPGGFSGDASRLANLAAQPEFKALLEQVAMLTRTVNQLNETLNRLSAGSAGGGNQAGCGAYYPWGRTVIVAFGGLNPMAAKMTAVDAFDPNCRRTWSLPPIPVDGQGNHATAFVPPFVYLFGNDGLSGRSRSFHTGTGNWSSLPDMPTPRHGLTAAAYVVGSGSNATSYVSVLGGITSASDYGSTVHERFRVDIGQWISDGTALPSKRFWTAAVTTASSDGFYLIGGCNGITYTPTAAVERYFAHNDSWISLAPMTMPRCGLAAVLCGGGLYALGGCDSPGFPANATNSAEVYSPSSNQWTTIAPLNVPRSVLGAVCFDGAVWALGGYPATNAVEVYDAQHNRWVSVTDDAGNSAMQTPRFAFGALALPIPW
eukprot:TRINITY_DN1183_c0_g1_i1.p1 TRINITY_DN1183_c0_g1~~TRINITY_DN1183_c0_g1_i1.p1  ORF type:complete len:461 (-),score=37.18 TRINITY_DN1183_c0_g1_i1:157-1452(-)